MLKFWSQRERNLLGHKLSPFWLESIVIVSCLEDLGIILIEPSSVHLCVVSVKSFSQTVSTNITIPLMLNLFHH